jgi:hypothetical protein
MKVASVRQKCVHSFSNEGVKHLEECSGIICLCDFWYNLSATCNCDLCSAFQYNTYFGLIGHLQVCNLVCRSLKVTATAPILS